MASNQDSSPLCSAWVISDHSSVHIANHRSWFLEDYTPFASEVSSTIGGPDMKVVGVGTVVIPTKRRPSRRSGPKKHAKIRLENVLHVPDSICNLICITIPHNYDWVVFCKRRKTSKSSGLVHDYNGRQVAYIQTPNKKRPFLQLKLSGPPYGPKAGPPVLKSEHSYIMSIYWPDEERKRLQAVQASMSQDPGNYPLNDAETAWLRMNFTDEHEFLQAHGLDIYEKEDHEQGRRLIRAMIKEQEAEGPSDDEWSTTDSDESDADGLEKAFRSRMRTKRGYLQRVAASYNLYLRFRTEVLKGDQKRWSVSDERDRT